jgi:hypothetical protein
MTQPIERGKVVGRKEARDDAGGGSDTGADQPLTPLETVLQAHPDISVCRDNLGYLRIVQQVQTGLRLIGIDVEKERGTMSRYPTVSISAVNTSVNGYFSSLDGEHGNQYEYGLVTRVQVHTDIDETVRAEVEYKKGKPIPPDMPLFEQRITEHNARPIPAYELVTVVRNGLEILNAYTQASRDEREKIDNTYKGWFDHGDAQVLDGFRPHIARDLASAVPHFYQAFQSEIDQQQYAGGNTFFALNTLRKVTEEMFPQEMPPAPSI